VGRERAVIDKRSLLLFDADADLVVELLISQHEGQSDVVASLKEQRAVLARCVQASDGDEWLEAIDLVLLRTPMLSRSSEPMPIALATLDAVHLATALIWRDRMGAVADNDDPRYGPRPGRPGIRIRCARDLNAGVSRPNVAVREGEGVPNFFYVPLDRTCRCLKHSTR
jgi:hypothetical protein